MKAGSRAVGVAESYGGRAEGSCQGDESPGGGRSTLAAAVVRADCVVDGFRFGDCSIGGTDATAATIDLLGGLDREDVQYVFVAGIAPAWYNILDLAPIAEAVGRPVVSVSFEESPGLEPALRREFDGEDLERRLSVYDRQPPRERLLVDDEVVYLRAVGAGSEEAREAVRAFTPEGGRPEPLRVARLAARAADRWRAVS